MNRAHVLGDLQLAIMRVLWAEAEATAGQVHEALLDDRGLAPTTIATMLRKMENKGVVAHRTEGRQFVYRPTVAEHEVHRSMVAELVDRVFEGDAAALAGHLLTERDFDPANLARLKALIAAKEQQAEVNDAD